jgi:hypothetical protein
MASYLDYLFPMGQSNPSIAGLLGEEESNRMRQQAQQAGLLNFGAALLANSGPTNQPMSFGQRLAPALLGGYGAAQESLEKQTQGQINATRLAEAKRQMEIRQLLPQLYTETTDEQGNKSRTINRDVFQRITLENPELAKQISEGQISARKAGLLPGMETNAPSPFAPYLQALSPQVRTLAQQLERGYKSGVIDEETALKRIDALAKMEDQYSGRQESAADRALTRDMARQEREAKKGELSTEQQKQVTGAQNTVNAITEFTKELESFDPRSFASLSPSARSKIQTKYRNMQLQAKEAYNLGVLNGPDLTIIEQLVADPTAIRGAAIGKAGIDAQAQELKRIVTDMGNVASMKPKTVTGGAAQPNMPSMPTMSAIDAEIARRKKGQQ